jgi:hypothetical protein
VTSPHAHQGGATNQSDVQTVRRGRAGPPWRKETRWPLFSVVRSIIFHDVAKAATLGEYQIYGVAEQVDVDRLVGFPLPVAFEMRP